MMDNGKTLIQQAPGLGQSPESIAAAALEKILSRSPSARVGLAHLVEQQSGRINPIMSVKIQEAADYPRDLVAVDAQGAAQVILVPLFDAKIPYLNGGLNHCFDRLTDDGNSTLLFVVPEGTEMDGVAGNGDSGAVGRQKATRRFLVDAQRHRGR